jgi:glycerol-1-phosphate dehydrogenase [NAD(P)+]
MIPEARRPAERIRTRSRRAREEVSSTADLRADVDYPIVAVSASADNNAEIADQFRAWLTECGPERPAVVHGHHATALAAAVTDAVSVITPTRSADMHWTTGLVEEIADKGADAVVAIGGGRCLDLAKLAASRAGIPVFVVPTQLSHDGICSPVAVVPGADGLAQSLPAVAPTAAFFSIPTLRRSPIRSIRAGLGDLMTNPLALRDWELASEMGHDELHEGAWHLSMESHEMIDRWLEGVTERDARDPQFLGLLAYALANSGLAMMRAGSSRPASGAEHKISHAIDLLYGGRALHGEQVAFASIIATALHGLEVAPVIRRVTALGLPSHPAHLDLSHEQVAEAILAAPATRPHRWTALEHANLDRAGALALVTSLWGAA